MIRKNDISTPEGYFEDLQLRLSEIPSQPQKVGGVRRITPYLAYAASLVVAVMLGNFILRKTAAPSADDSWAYVSYLADALDPDGPGDVGILGGDSLAPLRVNDDDRKPRIHQELFLLAIG